LAVYLESSWFGLSYTPSEFKATVTIAVGNKGAFDVTIWNPKVKLIINGIDMGTLRFEEDWYIIPAFGWSKWKGTFSVTGSDADALQRANTRTVNLILRGEASRSFYRTNFETSS
jgi:hypothetical protein